MLFDSRLQDNTDGLLDRVLTTDDKIEHLFEGFGSVVTSFFMQIGMASGIHGPGWPHQHAQAMATSASINYQNHVYGKWAPILGILCDGRTMRFYLYDSAAANGDPTFFCSRLIEGLPYSDGSSIYDRIEGILRGQFPGLAIPFDL